MSSTQEKSSQLCNECGAYGYYHDLMQNNFIFKHIDLIQAISWGVSWYLAIELNFFILGLTSVMLTLLGDQITTARGYVTFKH